MYPPTRFQTTRGNLWLCGEDDVTTEFLSSLHPATLIVTCKDHRVFSVDRAAEQNKLQKPMWLNLTYHKTQWSEFFGVLDRVVEVINSNSAVVVHDRTGCHRAALLTALILMFGNRIPFDECKEIVIAQRPVRIDEIQHSHRRTDGSWSEDHERWIRKFERLALDTNKSKFHFLPTPVKLPRTDTELLASSRRAQASRDHGYFEKRGNQE